MQFGGQAPGTSEDQRQAAFRKFGFEFVRFQSCNSYPIECEHPDTVCQGICLISLAEYAQPNLHEHTRMSEVCIVQICCCQMRGQEGQLLVSLLLQDVMDKLEVNGPNAHPMYKFLREREPKSVGGGSRVPNGSSAIEWCTLKLEPVHVFLCLADGIMPSLSP